MSRTLKALMFCGLAFTATTFAAGTAHALDATSSSGYQPASSTDAPFISRDFAFSGGALYNNAPSTGTSHSVTTSLGISGSNLTPTFSFEGNGNGNMVTCTVYAINGNTGSVISGANSKAAVGICFIPTITLNLAPEATYYFNAQCDLPPATSTGAFSVFWGSQ